MRRSTLSALACGGAACAVLAFGAAAESVVQEWSSIRPPPAPELKAVTVEPNRTALLMLDFMNQNCTPRPRCVASLPAVQKLVGEARSKQMTVVHSIVPNTTVRDIRNEVAPREGEPSVQAGPDKFFRTDLEEILRSRQIQTVIVTGTAAHGAVLYTASSAALRGFDVVVPVDGMSSEPAYPEQYTAWHLANAPVISAKVRLTHIDMIKF